MVTLIGSFQLVVLIVQQRVQILANAGDMNKTDALEVAQTTQAYGFDFALVDQEIRRAARNSKQWAQVGHPTELRGQLLSGIILDRLKSVEFGLVWIGAE